MERPRGLPIGNLTSQFLANLHLNDLDHCLSALPGVCAYLSHEDDLALFADHREPLLRARSRLEAEPAALRLRAALGTTIPGIAARPTATKTSPTMPTTTSGFVWCASPSTLRRQNRWKGFQWEIRKGPDPLP